MLNKQADIKSFQQHILKWYAEHKRDLPWRQSPSNPYHTLLSEIMLQQTTVATVLSYFAHFTEKWPTIEEFASASQDEILASWSGLGYYNRARNLHKAAKAICNDYNGQVPSSREELLKLPGIGPYTSAAIASIAFDKAETVVDGNIERVMMRLFALQKPKNEVREAIYEYASRLTPQKHPGDYAQALMDLGATICRPKNPLCFSCPVAKPCQAFKQSLQNIIPVKKPKAEKPKKYGAVFVIQSGNEVLIEKRPEKGLLANLYQFPTTEWLKEEFSIEHYLSQAPFDANWSISHERVKHVFTHFELYLLPFYIDLPKKKPIQGKKWHHLDQIDEIGFPTLMKKVMQKTIPIELAA